MHAANRSARKTRVAKTLWPPQAGTIKLKKQYGDALLCVRYRHDTSGLRRFTTIELVVDQAPVAGTRADGRLYAVHILHTEDRLREQARSCGAQWDEHAQKWLMNGALVRQLGLEDRARALRKKPLQIEICVPARQGPPENTPSKPTD